MLQQKYGKNVNDKRAQFEEEERLDLEEAKRRESEPEEDFEEEEYDVMNPQPRLIGRWQRTWTDTQLIQIGAYISNTRRKLNMAQSELSSKTKIINSMLSGIEKGKVKKLDIHTLKKIGFHLKDDMQELLLELGRKNVITAMPASGVKRKKAHTEEFEFENKGIICAINEDNFIISWRSEGHVQELYNGKKVRMNPFLEAMEEVIKSIRKTI